MSSSYQIFFDGQPADADFYTAIASLEVEENMDLPGAVQLSLPVSRTQDGDLTYVSDNRLRPMANLAVVVNPSADAASGVANAVASIIGGSGGGGGSGAQCIFDGYVLSHKLHLNTGITNSTLAVWGQDASWLMNLTEKVKEWVDVTDADAANSIFGDYGITPADDNVADDSPSHTESGHSLMQRASDIQFLRNLARRNGKFCRITCADKPGVRTGYFATPKLDGSPTTTLVINDLQAWNVQTLDLEWEATTPTAVIAHQALFTDSDPDGVSADTTDPGLPLLSDRGLADFSGKPMTVLLAAPVDDGGELTLRAQSLLRESAWFVRCEGEADVARLGAVLRVGTIVAIDGVGALHSGKYLVWSVRHTITPDDHKMKFVLVRNAVGAPQAGGTGGLAALVGAL
jgi:phage protein D